MPVVTNDDAAREIAADFWQFAGGHDVGIGRYGLIVRCNTNSDERFLHVCILVKNYPVNSQAVAVEVARLLADRFPRAWAGVAQPEMWQVVVPNVFG